MSFDRPLASASATLVRPRWLSIAALVALSVTAPLTNGCAAADDVVDADSAFNNAVTDVDHAAVKRQSIGNCWLYATVGWAESLNKAATGKELNLSESYLTYWDWFDKIANGTARGEISTGGTYATAAELVNRYGLMLEGDFIPAEANADMSAKQASAERAINAALTTGALKDASARRNRGLVRKELDKAWGLQPDVSAQLDKVFGTTVGQTISRNYTSKPLPAGTKVIRAADLPVRVVDAKTHTAAQATLLDVIGQRGSFFMQRTGKLAWNEVNYPSDPTGRRDFQKRVQRALGDSQPVIISWSVDFNALTSSAVFSKQQLDKLGPGRQGGHMTLLEDYQVENVPGFGTLKAGVPASVEAQTAALDSKATITFFRIKNSWGAFRPDRWKDAVMPGYHDLNMDYLNGPIKKCVEKNGTSDPNNCPTTQVPLWGVVLPAGY